MNIEALYQEVLRKSRHMHELASSSAWDALIDAETERRQAVTRLREALEGKADNDVPDELKLQIRQCIEETLALDRQTETLVSAWMKIISQELGSVNTAKRMQRAYAGA